MNKTDYDNIVSAIYTVHYTSIYNLQYWVSKNPKTLYGSLLRAGQIIKKLVGENLITEMVNYSYPFGRYRWNTFYTCTRKGERYVHGSTKRFAKYLSKFMISHQSALIDCLMAFYFLYPECKFDIDFNKTFNWSFICDDGYKQSKSYQPDAFIKMTLPDESKHFYILELERTRSHEDICNKIKINQSMFNSNNMKLNKLDERTRVLYVYTQEHFDVFKRPLQYEDDGIKQKIEGLNNSLTRLLKKVQALELTTPQRYLFLRYHDFYHLNEAVWHQIDGSPRKLIQ